MPKRPNGRRLQTPDSRVRIPSDTRTLDAAATGVALGLLLVALTDERFTLFVILTSGGMALALLLPMSRRVMVAWSTWATLRWRWRRRPQSWRRWLWLVTLRHANGQLYDMVSVPKR